MLVVKFHNNIIKLTVQNRKSNVMVPNNNKELVGIRSVRLSLGNAPMAYSNYTYDGTLYCKNSSLTIQRNKSVYI